MSEIRVSWRPLSVAAHALIALEVVLRWVLVARSYWWQDDLVHLDAVRDAPLSADLVVRDYHDHLELGTNLVYWLIGRLDTSGYWPAVLVVVTLTAICGALMWRLLVALFGEQALLLVPLALYLFSPLALVPATWFASALQELPLQACWLLLLLSLVRLETSRRWAFVAVGAFAVALFFWEKALIALPLSALFLLLVAWRDLPWRSRLARIRQQGWVWLALAVLAAGYVALYVAITDGSERGAGATRSYADAAAEMVLQVFLPANFGGPWWVRGAANTLFPTTPTAMVVVFAVLTGVVVVASFVVSGRRAAGAWLMVLAHLAVAVGLVLWGRAGYLDLVARDPRYLVEVTLTVSLCLAAAFLPLRAAAPDRRTEVGVAGAAAGAVALVASCLLTTFQLVPQVTHDFGRNYLQAAARSIQDRPGASFVDQSVPRAIVPMSLARAMHAVGEEHGAFDQPARQLWMLDGFGLARKVAVQDAVVDATGPDAGCWRVGAAEHVVTDLPEDLPHPAVARVGYLAGEAGTLRVTVGGITQRVPVGTGLDSVWLVVRHAGRGPTPMTMSFEARTPRGAGLCVGQVTVGSPWPAPD